MNKKIEKIIGTTILVITLFSTGVQAAQKTIKDVMDTGYSYDNTIYQNGFEDTYLFETNDSVVITKTGLTRNKPELFGKYEKNYYPSPSNEVKDKGQLANVLAESKEIMEQVEENIAKGTLKKHIAADGQYGDSLSEEAKAVEKIVYVNSNLKGGHALAVYAPAGEVVTVTIPEEYIYLANQGKLSISVGLGYNADNVSNRMPRLSKKFVPTQSITKVGNPFGGMVYITLSTDTPDGLTIPVTVNGAVDTPYYDLGTTTLEQWQQAKNAPGLYAELRTPYMRILVPSTEIRNLADPYDALVFWTNVGALSTYPFGAQGRTLPITMIYDYYVFAGAAVATVGAWQCNFPVDWAKNALNYESMMASGGWGNLHEFNHHWQGTYNTNGKWGVGAVGEVTNNVMNAASYILYTNIAAYRTEAGYSDWKKVADPYLNLEQTLKDASSGKEVTSVYMYVSFMHEFGVQNYLEVIKSNYSGGVYNGITLNAYNTKDTREDDLAYRTSVIMRKDLTYYFKEVLHFNLKNETIKKIKALNFEEYIPVQNLYTAGVKGIETGRTYYIPKTEYTFDFNKYMSSPAEVEILSVSQPKYGTMNKNTDGTYTYLPNDTMPEDEVDTYELTVRLKANGITQERVLQGKIGYNYHISKLEKYEIDQANTEQAIALSKTMSPYETSYITQANYKTDIGNNLTKGTGYFVAPESGEYEFQAYGDDKISFNLLGQSGTYTSTTNTYLSSAASAYANKNATHFTIQLKEAEVYTYELYTNNTGGNGAGNIAYRKVGTTTWKDIPSTSLYCQKQDVGKQTSREFKQPETPYYKRELRKITNQINLDYNNAKVLETPNKQNSEGNDGSSIIDWNRSTFFHSKYSGGNITAFPHNYVIDLGEEKEFNKIEIYTRANNTNGTIGDYEILVSNDNQNWTQIASDQTRKGNSSAPVTISKSIQTTKARYVKIKAINNKNGNNFTIVSSIELSNEIPIADKIAQNSSKIIYKGDWIRQVDGNYINGATYQSNNGSLQYAYKGSETAIYSAKNAIVKIKVDDQDWVQYNIEGSKYSPSVILKQEQNKTHKVQVQVVSGEFALNMIATNGQFTVYQEQESPEEELTITSTIYKIEGETIAQIAPETSIQEFKKQITTNAKTIKFYNKNKEEITQGILGTGMTIELNEGEKVFELVVRGDINGDGKLSVIDLVNMKKQLVGLISLSKVNTKAADINGDGKLSVVDLVNLKKALVGLIEL